MPEPVQPVSGLRVNAPLLDGAAGSAQYDANYWAILWMGEVSPDGGYVQLRLIGGPDGMQAYIQAIAPAAAGEVLLSLNGRSLPVAYRTSAGWSFGERCGGSPPWSCRGWSAERRIPWSELGGKPAVGVEWPLVMSAYGSEWRGVLHWGLPDYAGANVAGAKVLTIPLSSDAMLGGGTDCGSPDYPHYFPTWGARNWGASGHVNIQAQWDTADWPCYARYYAGWSLASLPTGAQVVSATVQMRMFGNPGYGPGYNENGSLNTDNGTGETLVQVYEVDEAWREATITWDSAPPAVENISRTLVRPLPRTCLPTGSWYCSPGIPYAFDVTEIVKRAVEAERSWASMALYTAAGQYHSGKYFSSREGAEPPLVYIAYRLPAAAPTPQSTRTSTPTSTPRSTPTSTPGPTTEPPQR